MSSSPLVPSPLNFIRSPLSFFFKFRAFPGRLSRDYVSIKVSLVSCFLCLFISLSFYSSFTILYLECIRQGTSMMDLGANSGLTGVTDSFSYFLMVLVCYFSIGGNIVVLYKSQMKMNQLFHSFHGIKLQIKPKTFQKEVLPTLKHTAVGWFFIAILTAFMDTLFCYQLITYSQIEQNAITYTGIALVFPQQLFSNFNFNLLCIDIIVHVTLGYIAFILKTWSHQLKQNKQNNQNKQYIETTDYLIELVRLSDTAFGPYLTLNFATSLIVSFLATFQSMTFFFTLDVAHFSIMHWAQVANGPLLALLNGWRTYGYIWMGQSLANAVAEVKEALENCSMTNTDNLNRKELSEIEHVLAKMPVEAPIKPLGYFLLNKKSFVNTCATSTTYSIILLQFKQAGF